MNIVFRLSETSKHLGYKNTAWAMKIYILIAGLYYFQHLTNTPEHITKITISEKLSTPDFIICQNVTLSPDWLIKTCNRPIRSEGVAFGNRL